MDKEYVPKNEIEKDILRANPDHNPDFDFSDDAYFEEYILEHKDDFDFMVQVARVQGDNSIELGNAVGEVSYLLAERPLVVLEAVQNFDKSSHAIPDYIVNHFRAIGEEDVLSVGATSREHRDLVFDFIRQNIKDKNDYSKISVPEIQKEWKDFQKKNAQRKLLQKFSVDVSDIENAEVKDFYRNLLNDFSVFYRSCSICFKQ